MKAEDIENYLSQLGQELLKRGIEEPIHLLLVGGAYMLLLTTTPRNTDDIDIFWLEEEEGLQRALRPLQESVIAVAEANQIDPNWLNYMTQLLMYDLVIVPEGNLWKTFGPVHIYAPPQEYILALKIFGDAIKTSKTVKYSSSRERSVHDNKPNFYLIGTFYPMHDKIMPKQLQDHSTSFMGSNDSSQQLTTEWNHDTNR